MSPEQAGWRSLYPGDLCGRLPPSPKQVRINRRRRLRSIQLQPELPIRRPHWFNGQPHSNRRIDVDTGRDDKKRCPGRSRSNRCDGGFGVADNSAAIRLFEKHGSDRDKLLSLLTQNIIVCWARGRTGGDLVFVPGQVWNTGAKFQFVPMSENGSINQTYLYTRTPLTAPSAEFF